MKYIMIIRTLLLYVMLIAIYTIGMSCLSNNFLNIVWPKFEVSTLLLALAIFLQNALHRYALFGFKPTFIVAVCDPKLQKVAMLQYRKSTGGLLPYLKLVQGGDIGANAYASVKEACLHRLRFTLEKVSFTFYETIPLGVCWSEDYITKVSTDRFSLFPSWLGKGFLMSIISMDLSEDTTKIFSVDGRNVASYSIIDIDEVKYHLEQGAKDPGSDASPKVYEKVHKILTDYMSNMKKKYEDPAPEKTQE